MENTLYDKFMNGDISLMVTVKWYMCHFLIHIINDLVKRIFTNN